MRETLDFQENEDTQEKARTSLHRTISRQHLMLLSDGDELVSMTAFNSSIEDIVQIGGVFTPPQWRKRGYARQVVAAHLQHAARQGDQKKHLVYWGRKPSSTVLLSLLRLPNNWRIWNAICE